MAELCVTDNCRIILSSICVFYEGDSLVYTGINKNDSLHVALQKIDAKFADATVGYVFTNGVRQSAPGEPVKLGGQLTENTVIDSNGKTFKVSLSVESGKFITTGGNSNQFVKGDGTLDSNSYQLSGNYITGLTGDVTASGPGSVAATLATVNASPGSYGSNSSVPVFSVDAKGRVTSVTNTPINYPAQSLSFSGDVSGSGFTGSTVSLTLATVNSNVYASNTFLKFAVNGKGLVTSATPVGSSDITGALGYTPVPESRTITINGNTQDLSANRSWTINSGEGNVGFKRTFLLMGG